MTGAVLSLSQSTGRHDTAKRRKSQRRGRETGCWVYIPGELIERGGFADEPKPFYRVWGGQRGRYVVTLYREP